MSDLPLNGLNVLWCYFLQHVHCQLCVVDGPGIRALLGFELRTLKEALSQDNENVERAHRCGKVIQCMEKMYGLSMFDFLKVIIYESCRRDIEKQVPFGRF